MHKNFTSIVGWETHLRYLWTRIETKWRSKERHEICFILIVTRDGGKRKDGNWKKELL